MIENIKNKLMEIKCMYIYAAIALLFAKILPYIIRANIVKKSEHTLSMAAFNITEIIGIIALVLFLGFAYRVSIADTISKAFTKATFFALAFIWIESIGDSRIATALGFNYANNIIVPIVYTAIYVVVAFSLVLISFLILGKKQISRGILGSISILIVNSGYRYLDGIVSETGHASVFLTVLFMILAAVIETFIICKIVLSGKKEQSSETIIKEDRNTKIRISLILAGVVLVICCTFQIVINNYYNPVYYIVEDLNTDKTLGFAYLLDGEFDVASQYFNSLNDKREMWEDIASNKFDADISASEQAKENPIIQLMRIESDNDSDAMLEFVYKCNTLSNQMILYDMYGDLEELDDSKKEIQKILFYNMCANNIFVRDDISVADVQKQSEKLIDSLAYFSGYEEVINEIDYFKSIAEIEVISEEKLKFILEKAEENPENIIYQYIACLYGTQYKDDYAKEYYDRIDEIAKNYLQLYESTMEPDEECLISTKKQVATWMMNIRHRRDAIELLSEINDEESKHLIMQCHYALDEMDKVTEIAEEIFSDNPHDMEALYYCSIDRIKAEDKDKSIEYLSLMADGLKNADDAEKNNYATLLFTALEYFCVHDTYANFVYNQYQYLNDEQKEELKKNEFLYNCTKSVLKSYATDSDFDYSFADKVMEEIGEVPQVLYTKGTTAYNAEDFDTAIECYTKSLEMMSDNPNCWYMLANAYDAKRDYKAAYECCEKCYKLIPQTDHNYDVFGVGYHNEKLMQALKVKLDK